MNGQIIKLYVYILDQLQTQFGDYSSMADNVAALLVKLFCVGSNISYIKLHCIYSSVEAVIQSALKFEKKDIVITYFFKHRSFAFND